MMSVTANLQFILDNTMMGHCICCFARWSACPDAGWVSDMCIKRKRREFFNFLRFSTQTRCCCIVGYWCVNYPNCVKMRYFATDWYWTYVSSWVFGVYEQFAKNPLSCSVKRWPKVTNAKSLRVTDEYCVIFTRRYKKGTTWW